MRKPRNRANKHKVAPEGWVLEVYDVDVEPIMQLPEATWHALLVMLKVQGQLDDVKRAEWRTRQDLQSLATSYIGWRTCPIPSRSEARYQLRKINDLAGRVAELSDGEFAELQELVRRPNNDAQSALWAGVASFGALAPGRYVHEWLCSDKVDWSAVAIAAAAGAARFRGGDYSNRNLGFAMSALVDIYEGHTARRATMNKAGAEASPACKFARTFFAIVDPGLPERSIDNRLDQTLRARRKRPRARALAQSFRPAF